MTVEHSPENAATLADWKAVVRKYQQPSLRRGLWQIFNSVGGYIATWVLLYVAVPLSPWLAVPLILLGGGLMVRMFIIFHDCTHGSFFRTRKANDAIGFLIGVLVFTPYSLWRKEHALHHSTAADLDRRGFGDVPTMTVEEYRAASRWKQLGYRLVRHPLVLFGIGPILMFLIKHRLPFSPAVSQRERNAVHFTNLALAGLALGMSQIFGFFPYLLLQVAILAIAASWGTWLFYVQHQFEGVYWERKDKWTFVEAALQGSSFYKLPRVLQWFSGNIGYHHIHHLSSRIPNYHLERCHNAEPMFQAVKPVTFWASLDALSFRLWDEAEHRLVGFGAVRGLSL